MSRPLLGGGWFQVLVWTQVSIALGDFVTLRLIRECALGPLEASALGGKTSSPYGKVKVRMLNLVFKKQHSTADCTFVLKRTVYYYRRNASHVFAGFIDFNKAFDSVDYWLFFIKTHAKGFKKLKFSSR